MIEKRPKRLTYGTPVQVFQEQLINSKQMYLGATEDADFFQLLRPMFLLHSSVIILRKQSFYDLDRTWIAMLSQG